MQATHRDAEERYNDIREAVISVVNGELSDRGGGSRAGLIDHTALAQATNWDSLVERSVDWDWSRLYSKYRRLHPKRFELALWRGEKLVSLSLGRPTYTGSRLRLDFIEGAPDRSNGEKLFGITLLAMNTYASALGAYELRVMNPINSDVRDYYKSFGLTYVSEGDYLYMRL